MPEPLRWDMILPDGQPLRWDMPGFVWGGNVPEQLYPNNTMPTQQNLADVTITDTAHTSITTKLAAVRTEIEAVAVEVPADVSENLFRLGDKRLMFDQKCDTNMHQFPASKPADVDLPKYDSDGSNITNLRAYRAVALAMLERLDGAIALHGSDRMDANLTYFQYLKFGIRTGLANAKAIHDDIKPHYPTGRRTTPAPAKNPA